MLLNQAPRFRETMTSTPLQAANANEIAAAKERIDDLRREVARAYIGSTRALDLMGIGVPPRM